jgi:hypothetical protein
MSALGQKRTSKRYSDAERPGKRRAGRLRPMSALPPKADIAERDGNVRFVPLADIDRLFDHLAGAG